jgi:integrase
MTRRRGGVLKSQRWTEFRSGYAGDIRLFIEAKRALGRKYWRDERILRLFDGFLFEHGVHGPSQLSPALLERFLGLAPGARYHNQLLGVVRRLLNWLVVQGKLRTSPLRAARRRVTAARVPFIFDAPLARRLLDAAGQLPDGSRAPRRGPVYRALFALCYGLGLRVGEACQLRHRDIDLRRNVLTIRDGKFGKSRLVPFGPRMAGLLRQQLQQGDQQPALPERPLFTFDNRRPVHAGNVSMTFLALTRGLHLSIPEGCSSPRLHDLRHSFAVGTLLRWYREGVNASARLHYLSTFMGHADPASTAVYLTITDELLHEANRRFEGFAAPTVGTKS